MFSFLALTLHDSLGIASQTDIHSCMLKRKQKAKTDKLYVDIYLPSYFTWR